MARQPYYASLRRRTLSGRAKCREPSVSRRWSSQRSTSSTRNLTCRPTRNPGGPSPRLRHRYTVATGTARRLESSSRVSMPWSMDESRVPIRLRVDSTVTSTLPIRNAAHLPKQFLRPKLNARVTVWCVRLRDRLSRHSMSHIRVSPVLQRLAVVRASTVSPDCRRRRHGTLGSVPHLGRCDIESTRRLLAGVVVVGACCRRGERRHCSGGCAAACAARRSRALGPDLARLYRGVGVDVAATTRWVGGARP